MLLMKRIFAAFTAVLLICLAAGCGAETGEDKKINSPEPGRTTETGGSNAINNEFTIDEQVCFEYGGVKVTAKSVEKDSIWGTGIKLLIENDSDKDYSVGTDAVIVNNCMVSSLFSCSVSAGKKANDVLYLSSSSLNAAGIEKIGQIEMYFYLYDSSDYKRVYNADCVTVKTSLYDTMDTSADSTGHELYNKNEIRIVGKYVDENTFWGSSVLLYIENNSDKNITVSCDDMSVNGFMVISLSSTTVYKNKYAFGDITILSSSLEENGITSIDTIELKFKIYEADTFKTIDTTEMLNFPAK